MTASRPEIDQDQDDAQRIVSWKAIAAFFERDERTVKRWERERGLPVHRVPGGERGILCLPGGIDRMARISTASLPSLRARRPALQPAALRKRPRRFFRSSHSRAPHAPRGTDETC